MNTKPDYAQRIEALIAEHKWDRTMAARKLSMSYPGLKKILDSGGEFGVDKLFYAAKVFDVSPYWLHTGEGERYSFAQCIRPMAAGGQAPQSQPVHGLSDQAVTLGRLLDSTCDDVLEKTEALRRAAAAVLAQPRNAAQKSEPAPGAADQAGKPSA